MAIIVRGDLQAWQVLNVVAHCAARMANKMCGHFDTGEYFVTRDGKNHPRNSQYPIIVFRADGSDDLRTLLMGVRSASLPHLAFIREMIDFTDDAELQKALDGKTESELEYLGVGMFGENDTVKQLTRKFSLWK